MPRPHDHTRRTLGRKLTEQERLVLAHLYVKLRRRDRRLQRVAARHREELA